MLHHLEVCAEGTVPVFNGSLPVCFLRGQPRVIVEVVHTAALPFVLAKPLTAKVLEAYLNGGRD